MIPRYVLAPNVPTPPEVVEHMLAMAEVKSTDTVYDIGCGDGRIAIAAAKRGATCLGVDIETYWIELSQKNALAAGVSDLIQFKECDATELDFRPASVVFMYLVEWSTQMIAKSLISQCAPGTRVVSHSFAFTKVPTTRTESVVDAEGQNRRVHLWVLGESVTP